MKVNPTQYSLAVATLNASAPPKTQPKADEGNSVEKNHPVDPVLGEAQNQIGVMPEVDMARVEAMKEAINAGKISINLDELTDAMQKYYQR